MQKLFVFISLIILISCSKSKIPVYEIVIAKKIYICDSLFSTAEAIVISNNQIIAWGDKDDVNQKFSSKKITKYDWLVSGYYYASFFHMFLIQVTPLVKMIVAGKMVLLEG